MRLDPDTVAPTVRAVRETFGANAEVWLFGSRADDNMRGGDIDFYIETDFERDIVARRATLRQELAGIFGEQKIDLAVRPRCRDLHPLHLIAREQGIRLSESVCT